MNSRLAIRLLAIAAFSWLLAPTVAFIGVVAVMSVAERTIVLPHLSELPGLYLEAGPAVSLASALFAALVGIVSRWTALVVTRAGATALGALAFAVVFVGPVVELFLIAGRASPTQILIAGLGVVAGASVGALLPKTLLALALPPNGA